MIQFFPIIGIEHFEFSASRTTIRKGKNMMWLRILLIVTLLLLVSCSDDPPTVGTDQTFATACDEANDGQRIALQGYLRLPDSFTGDQSVVLRLYETDTFSGVPVGATIPIGTEANEMADVPVSYSDNDLLINLNDGSVAGNGDRVKVSGKMYYPLVDQDFECGLENVLVEPAG
jgi:hypothetical protein